LFDFLLLVSSGVITGIAGEGDPYAFEMQEIAMAAFASPVLKPGFGQHGHQLSDLLWHMLKMVSLRY
jgi:hypothetical protein